MIKDFADLLVSLNKEGVAYVVIGEMAVLRRVPYRTTRDIDVLIESTQENAIRARPAVADGLGAEPKFSAEVFLSGDILSFGGLLRIDIHSQVPGADWPGVWQRKQAGEFAGVATHFASFEDLISMKRASGYPAKDLPDLRRLEKLP